MERIRIPCKPAKDHGSPTTVLLPPLQPWVKNLVCVYYHREESTERLTLREMAFCATLLGQSHDLRRVEDLLESIDGELSLEATVLRERAMLLKKESVKLARQRAFLREERKKTREEADAIQHEKAQIERIRGNGWFPSGSLPGAGQEGATGNPKTLRFNIGGQTFEASQTVLKRDPDSLLAALCANDSPVQLQDDEGAFFFDRDWWLFRYILIFLRDGILPEERRLLVQLYREATFWNLESLRRAIEETQLSLARKNLKVEASGEIKEVDMEQQSWWSTLPKWLEAEKKEVDKKAVKPKDEKDGNGSKDDEGSTAGGSSGSSSKGPGEEKKGERKFLFKKDKKEEEDWWTGSEYKGKKYGVLSSAPDKVLAGDKDDDAIPMLRSTWERSVANPPKPAGQTIPLYTSTSSPAHPPLAPFGGQAAPEQSAIKRATASSVTRLGDGHRSPSPPPKISATTKTLG